MAIALDVAATTLAPGSNSKNTGSGAANSVLFVWTDDSTLVVTTPTVGGNAMTAVGANVNTNGTLTAGNLFYYVNPPSGTNTIVLGGATSQGGDYIVLSGVNTSSPIDATGGIGNVASGSLSVTLNTATANCWAVGGTDNSSGAPTPGGVLTTGAGGGPAIAHSNGTIATGSISGSFTFSGGGTGGMVLAKIAPAVATANGNFLAFM